MCRNGAGRPLTRLSLNMRLLPTIMMRLPILLLLSMLLPPGMQGFSGHRYFIHPKNRFWSRLHRECAICSLLATSQVQMLLVWYLYLEERSFLLESEYSYA